MFFDVDPFIWLTVVLGAIAVGLTVVLSFGGPRKAMPPGELRRAIFAAPDGSSQVEISVEMAMGRRQQRVGMMFRPSLDDGHGMYFRWKRSHRAGIWMRNVRIPLDLVFLSPAGRVMMIESRLPGGKALSGCRIVSGGLVEVPRGFCAKSGIRPGWIFSLVIGDRP